MSDDQTSNNGEGAVQETDANQNLKAEFSRKFNNVETQLAEMAKANAQLQALLQNQQASSSPSTQESEDIFDNPDAYVNRRVQAVEERIEKKIADRDRRAAEKQGALTTLTSQYPELNDSGSDLYKEAIKALQALPDEVRDTSVGYKTAVYQAAAELGIVAKSKRKSVSASEDFTLGGSKPPVKSKGNSEIPADVLETARLFGQPVDDPEYLKRLAKTSKRTNWIKSKPRS